jgi:hypothetical protein
MIRKRTDGITRIYVSRGGADLAGNEKTKFIIEEGIRVDYEHKINGLSTGPAEITWYVNNH